jgi:hypothetical protein
MRFFHGVTFKVLASSIAIEATCFKGVLVPKEFILILSSKRGEALPVLTSANSLFNQSSISLVLSLKLEKSYDIFFKNKLNVLID